MSPILLTPQSQHKDLICLSILGQMKQLALTFLPGPHLNCGVLAYTSIVYGWKNNCLKPLALDKNLTRPDLFLWRKTVNKVSPVFNQGRKQSGPAPIVLIEQPFLPGLSDTEQNWGLVLFCLPLTTYPYKRHEHKTQGQFSSHCIYAYKRRGGGTHIL